MSWMWESSSFLWNVIQKLDLAPLHPGWYYHLVVPWRLWIPWIDSDRNKARRSKKWSPQVISSCYFLLDGSPKLITHNLFATEFCHWNQWPLQAKALAEDFPKCGDCEEQSRGGKVAGRKQGREFRFGSYQWFRWVYENMFWKAFVRPSDFRIFTSSRVMNSYCVDDSSCFHRCFPFLTRRTPPKLQWFWRIHVLPQQTCHWTEPVEVVDEVECVIVAVLFKQVNEVTTAAAAGGHFASGR